MLTNEKSLKLLRDNELAKNTAAILNSTGANIFKKDNVTKALWEPEEVFDPTTARFVNYDEKYKSSLESVDSMNGKLSILEVINIISIIQKEYKKNVTIIKIK